MGYEIRKAEEAMEAVERKLFRADGSPRYSELEMEEQRAAARQVLEATLSKVEEEAREEIASAVAEAEDVKASDVYPHALDHLLGREKVQTLTPLIREDCETLPLDDLVGRVRSALRRGDSVEQLLWTRGVRRRLQAEGQGPPLTGQAQIAHANQTMALRYLLDELTDRATPEQKRKLASLRAKREGAQDQLAEVNKARLRLNAEADRQVARKRVGSVL